MVVLLLYSGGSVHDYTDGKVIILGRKDVDASFTFEVNSLLDAERLGKVK